MEKLTYVSVLSAVIDGKPVTPEMKEKLIALRDAQAKKNSAERKPTATQTANEGYKGAILTFLSENADKAFTINDLMKAVPEVAAAELTNQRVSALVRQMVLEGAVTRSEVKRKAYFQIAE